MQGDFRSITVQQVARLGISDAMVLVRRGPWKGSQSRTNLPLTLTFALTSYMVERRADQVEPRLELKPVASRVRRIEQVVYRDQLCAAEASQTLALD